MQVILRGQVAPRVAKETGHEIVGEAIITGRKATGIFPEYEITIKLQDREITVDATELEASIEAVKKAAK